MPAAAVLAAPMAGHLRYKLTEGGMVAIEGLIRQLPDPPQRMTGWNAVFCGDVREMSPVRSSWPRIHSMPFGHSPAAGLLFLEPPILHYSLH